jgi:hypothetical protein
MSGAELLALRTVLAARRRALLDRLAVEAAEGKGANLHIIEPEGKPANLPVIEPGFLRLLSDLQTTIAAVDDELAAEGETP